MEVPMSTDHISFKFNCKRCDAAVTWAEDAPDDTILTCKGCGAQLATLGEMKEASMEKAKEEVQQAFRDAFRGAGWKLS
jgi:hypothetical protein